MGGFLARLAGYDRSSVLGWAAELRPAPPHHREAAGACKLPASDLMRFQQRYEQSAQPCEWTFTRRDLQVLLAKLKAKPDHLAA
jgi:hypothetical protein